MLDSFKEVLEKEREAEKIILDAREQAEIIKKRAQEKAEAVYKQTYKKTFDEANVTGQLVCYIFRRNGLIT